MKKAISALVLGAVLATSFSPAHAQTSKRSVAKMILELDQSNEEIKKINEQIADARSSRKTALWVGIPVTVGATALTLLAMFAEGMSTTGRDEASRSFYKKSGATALAAGGATAYYFHVKGNEIEELQKTLVLAEKKNNAAKAALALLDAE